MQFVNFYIPVAFLIVVSGKATDTSVGTTSSSVTTIPSNNTMLTNITATAPLVQNDETKPIQNDESQPIQNEVKIETTTVIPTRKPLNESTTKAPLIHDPLATKTTDTVPISTSLKPNATVAGKNNQKGAASKGGPGFLVTGLLLLSLSAIYA